MPNDLDTIFVVLVVEYTIKLILKLPMDTYSRKSFLRKQACKKAGSIFLISTKAMWLTVRCIMQYFLMKVFLIQLKWDFLYNLTLLTLNYCKKADFASFPEQLSNSVNFSHFWSSGTSKIVCWISDEIPPSLPSRTSNHWESCHPDVEFPQGKLH